MAELIVVTGGAYSGKTALIEALAARGHEVLPEAAYEVIDELVQTHGVDWQAEWRASNQVEFQRLITVRQHGREATARQSASRYVFCDRGVLDGKAYCELAGVPWPEDLHELAAALRYAHVFVLATLLGFDARPHTGRVDTYEDSIRVAALLDEIYAPRAGRVTHIPQLAVAKRADLVLGPLGLL